MVFILFSFTLLGCASFSGGGANPEKPNIIIFLVDDLGLMDSSTPFYSDGNAQLRAEYLNTYYHTPNLEKLAQQGMKFSRFYAHSVCSPSRISLFTGQNSARHKTTQWINPKTNNHGEHGPKNWNWKGLTKDSAELLKLLDANGFYNIHVGKGHFAPIGAEGEDPAKLGFDVNIGGSSYGMPKSYYAKNGFGEAHLKEKDRRVWNMTDYHGKEEFLTDALTFEAKKAIKSALDRKLPFFLYMSYYAVHYPFEAHPKYINNYRGKGAENEIETASNFASMVEGVDASMGSIINYLEQLEVADNTLVLFLGDNGTDAPRSTVESFPFDIEASKPLRGMKATSYEGGTRVPFVAAWLKPNKKNYWQKKIPIKRGAVNTQVSSLLDILPTLQDMFNEETPSNNEQYQAKNLDGVSLATQLSGKDNTHRKQKFLNHFPHEHRSSYFTTYVEGDWKLIYYYPFTHYHFSWKDPQRNQGAEQYQLFNLAVDPSESNNLAKEKPEKLKQMFSSMVTDLDSMGAMYPEAQGVAVKPVEP